MAEQRDYAAEILTAYKAGDADALARIAFALAQRAALADELERREADRKAARARQRKEERRRTTSRDSTRHSATDGDVATSDRQAATSGDTPSFSPTPPFTPSNQQITSLPRARELGDRLPTDTDREALWQFLNAVPNAERWIAELHAMLDGMPGHQPETPEHIGQAVRDYVLNDACAKANANQFRAYCRKLAQPKEAAANGNGKATSAAIVRRGGVAQRSFDNIRNAMEGEA